MINARWMQQAASVLRPGDWRYDVLYVSLIIFFSYSTRR